jgi:TonB-dependent starch-binding outer membrane protein SusC
MRIRAALIVLLATLASTAGAQTRLLTGQVSDSATGAPLAGAEITLKGTRQSAFTREGGSFRIEAPSEGIVLLVRSIGYKKREIEVPPEQTTIEIPLTRDIFNLEEIVVTSQATGVERRNLANAVVTLSASDLGHVPTATIEEQLQGKVVGADIQRNSGAPGGGTQVRLRGITSINAPAQPFYVVDGVIVSDVAIPSNLNEVTASGGPDQDDPINRIADLNPNDIETIEILKGASASAIYGSKASNGVVIITTKRGRVGSPEISFTQRFGFSELSHVLGSRTFHTAEEATAAFGDDAAALFTPGITYDHERELAGRKDLAVETSAGIRGGSENTKYFASGLVQSNPGIIANTGFQKQSLRVNLDQQLGSRIQTSFSTNLTHMLAQRGLTNNDNNGSSLYMALPFTPSFLDLTQRPDSTWPENPFVASNPLQTAALTKNDENVWRFIGAGQASLEVLATPRSSLRLSVNAGLDFFNQDNSLLFPPELQFEDDDGQPGTALKGAADNLNLNLDANVVHTYTPSGEGFTATTSSGVQYQRHSLDLTRIVSRNLVAGQGNVNAGTNIEVSQEREIVKDLGFFLQEEFLTLGRRLLLTAGVRADQSSLNAEAQHLFFYPKVSGSLRFPGFGGAVNGFKVRLAYGESGNQPRYAQKFTPLDATQNIGGVPGLGGTGVTGAKDLRPERQREIEGGLDAELLSAAATLQLTLYQKSISDLLLDRSLASSTGLLSEIRNGGKLRTRGIEVALATSPFQTARASWLSRVTFALTRSKVTELPVPPFGDIEEGKSPSQILGNDTLPDGKDTVRALGDATPDWRMSFSNDLSLRRFGLSFLLDWQQGGGIVNISKLLYDLAQNTADFVDPIPGETTTEGERRLSGSTRYFQPYVERASYLKLREVRISYELPASLVRKLWRAVRYARLSASAHNLFTVSPYTGLDPEVSNFGRQAAGAGYDIGPFPPSRSYWFTVDLGF